MVLQIAANAGQIVHHRHADRLKVLGWADARDLQQMGGVHGASAQDHFLGCPDGCVVAALPEGDADAAFSLEHQAAGKGFGFDAKVGAAFGFFQEGLGSGGTPSAVSVNLGIADAFLGSTVEVLAIRDSGQLGGLDEAVRQGEDSAVVLHF